MFISMKDYDKLTDDEKDKYKLVYLDYETKCIPCGYELKS